FHLGPFGHSVGRQNRARTKKFAIALAEPRLEHHPEAVRSWGTVKFIDLVIDGQIRGEKISTFAGHLRQLEVITNDFMPIGILCLGVNLVVDDFLVLLARSDLNQLAVGQHLALRASAASPWVQAGGKLRRVSGHPNSRACVGSDRGGRKLIAELWLGAAEATAIATAAGQQGAYGQGRYSHTEATMLKHFTPPCA